MDILFYARLVLRLKWRLAFLTCQIPMLWILLTCEPVNCTPSDEELVVTTKQGKVKGTSLNVLSGSVTAFLGIPYAESPTGDLRFKKPEPRRPWSGLWNADKYPNTCYQYVNNASSGLAWEEMWIPNTQLSEDCLYVNLWVPSPRPNRAAVMIWIYGGGFVSGTSSLAVYNGKNLAYAENVIVVSMNYRVGAFGFLALPGSRDVRGNMGLFDQRLALEWVRDNIAAFGGDPDSVTLFGESAGSASVHLHILSPESHSLFTRAIMQSGSANAPWAVLRDVEAKHRASVLAQRLQCAFGNDTELVSCLRAKRPEEIVDKSVGIVTGLLLSICVFTPVVDGDFLTDLPDELIRMNKSKKVQILAGVNKDEGSYFLPYEAPGFQTDSESLITREQFLEGMKMTIPDAGEIGVEAVVFQYTDWTDVNNATKNRDAFVDLVGDYNFICPFTHFADKMAEVGNAAYVYLFDHLASNADWPEWMGVMHGYEIEFVFGIPLDRKLNYTAAEETFSRNIMHYWATFAKTGNPNEPNMQGIAWPEYKHTDQKFVTLNTEARRIYMKYRAQQCALWNLFLPKLLQRTAHMDEVEQQWKEEFHRWNAYMSDWKSKFNAYNDKKDRCNST